MNNINQIINYIKLCFNSIKACSCCNNTDKEYDGTTLNKKNDDIIVSDEVAVNNEESIVNNDIYIDKDMDELIEYAKNSKTDVIENFV
jgi:hypothetical protein